MTPMEVTEALSQVAQIQMQGQKAQMEYNENIKLHMEVMRDIKKFIKELRDINKK